MLRTRKLTFEDEYYEWLEKNCHCVDDSCECKDFEEWFNDKMDDQAYNYDNEGLA